MTILQERSEWRERPVQEFILLPGARTKTCSVQMVASELDARFTIVCDNYYLSRPFQHLTPRNDDQKNCLPV